jgi:hypothetical protein
MTSHAPTVRAARVLALLAAAALVGGSNVPATAATPAASAAPSATIPKATSLPLRATPAVFVTPPAAAAAGPLFAYVDASGMAHFARARLDSRYSPVLDDDGATFHVPGKKDGPEHLLTWLEFSPDVLAMQPFLREAAAHTGVDADLLKAVIAVESHFNAKAVSKQGAVGLMQLTPVTADRYATAAERQQPAAQRMLDARINVLTGARMLADLTRRYGSIDVALAAWNAGEGTVRKAGGKVPEIPETEAHVHLVLELYWALLQRSMGRAAHGMQLHEAH